MFKLRKLATTALVRLLAVGLAFQESKQSNILENDDGPSCL